MILLFSKTLQKEKLPQQRPFNKYTEEFTAALQAAFFISVFPDPSQRKGVRFRNYAGF